MQAFAKPRVLIADREPVITDTLAIILEQYGFECRGVYSSTRALEVFPVFRPDILISCLLFFEGMHGVDLAMHVTDRYPKCGIILFSGILPAFKQILEDARKRGYNLNVFSKPMKPADIIRIAVDMIIPGKAHCA